MFGLFKKKSEVEKLDKKYEKLLEEAYKLSTTNRTLSDAKTAEANAVLDEIEKLKKKG
ncbi:Lacal_2735 family protein [Crocinitomix catalasitica]|uniref:Lacal_2735 family protein n=1 Tax=Crocinitomix catalasitica TaxID=184607 RepID=UPI000565272B|nr:Lacal_2735 family protein [Crocinitomix catalasitica]